MNGAADGKAKGGSHYPRDRLTPNRWRTDPPTRAVAFTMRRNGPPMPWGYRILAIFLAVLFIGWMVMVVW
jgi:hypothetical protein